jgi:hypothetical protein
LTKSDNSNAAVTLIMHILIKAKTSGKEDISCNLMATRQSQTKSQKNSQHNATVFKSFDCKIIYENIYKSIVKNP